MNPSIKLLIVLAASLEISFTYNTPANLLIIVVSCIYLAIHRIRPLSVLWLLVVPLIPAVGLFTTIYFFGSQQLTTAVALFTRMYAYVFAGATFTLTTSPLALAHSLEQNCHLPSKYAYGTLAAFNMLPKIKTTILTIKNAAAMRGVTLSWWSPRLYFKAVLVAINWSENLAQAMLSHGFVEGQPRSTYQIVRITPADLTWAISLLAVLQVPIIWRIMHL